MTWDQTSWSLQHILNKKQIVCQLTLSTYNKHKHSVALSLCFSTYMKKSVKSLALQHTTSNANLDSESEWILLRGQYSIRRSECFRVAGEMVKRVLEQSKIICMIRQTCLSWKNVETEYA